ncbi:hypothetical protein [Vulcanisaeta thermophila]|uniref:hypothetical protein n=1 Tax=Vulcanisaeta thermophila TaxID=867917 RepID=UPI000852D659|nr:hypothetical protein [Vulcanisaeta thermophila]
MNNYLYFIKWNEECLERLGVKGGVRDLSGGLLITVNGEYGELVNEALKCGFTVFARHYRFHALRFGSLESLNNVLKPLDLWVESDVINLVVNPLSVDFEYVARVLLDLGFNVELISEDDVEYSL